MKFVVDSSALIAIAANEPDRDRFVDCIDTAEEPLCSTMTLFETGTVLLSRKRFTSSAEIEAFFRTLRLQEQPFTKDHLTLALDAYARYGKGMGNRPYLNMGDCVSYALAKMYGVPLLYKGDDFVATDIASVLPA